MIQKLMQDVGQLVSRYSNGTSTGLLSATSATTAASAEVEDSLVRKVTGKKAASSCRFACHGLDTRMDMGCRNSQVQTEAGKTRRR